ncbi:unnamed protein product [Trichobilharzia szidati]|nr:unnamed protein product [Trichobilharzia szidati]
MSRVIMVEKNPKEISAISAKKKKNGPQKNVTHRNNIHDIRNTHLTPIRRASAKGDCRKPPKDSFSSRLTDHHKSKLKLPKIYQLNEIMKRSEIANYEAFINSEHTAGH